MTKIAIRVLLAGWFFWWVSGLRAEQPLRVGVFDVDASPPVGSPLAYDPTIGVTTPLTCRGIVLLGQEDPIVLCAVDWIGIANDGHREFRQRLAAAAGTKVERVAVHALHQHDAPWCDFTVDELLAGYGLRGVRFDSAFAHVVIDRAAEAVKAAKEKARPITHLGFAEAKVDQVASNRRILGPDGKVAHVRWTATKDPAVRAFPEGVIDPMVKLIGFWDQDKPVVVLTYYATHPQSYYRTGQANPDFPGLARNQRQQATGVMHVHFNGASGNIGAGKYNDGSPENRPVLAGRMAAGMSAAWDAVKKIPISAADVGWTNESVALPRAAHLDEQRLFAQMQDEKLAPLARNDAACALVWARRCRAGEKLDIGCLRLGPVRVLHMPGELFIEYQLAAQAMRPDLFVAMAAYGEYATWYIGTEIAYEQGGYETQPTSSFVAPQVEQVLLSAMRKLLDAQGKGPQRLGVNESPN